MSGSTYGGNIPIPHQGDQFPGGVSWKLDIFEQIFIIDLLCAGRSLRSLSTAMSNAELAPDLVIRILQEER